VVLNLGSIEPLGLRTWVLILGSIPDFCVPGFDGAVSGVRRRSTETCNPFLLSVTMGKNGVRQKFGKLRKVLACL